MDCCHRQSSTYFFMLVVQCTLYIIEIVYFDHMAKSMYTMVFRVQILSKNYQLELFFYTRYLLSV